MKNNLVSILLFEKNQDWRDLIIFTLDNFKIGRVASFDILEEAKNAYQKDIFDIVICGFDIANNHDKLMWVKELHQQRKKVITFSNEKVEGISHIKKGGYDGYKAINVINKLL
jgi:hypothetical protein